MSGAAAAGTGVACGQRAYRDRADIWVIVIEHSQKGAGNFLALTSGQPIYCRLADLSVIVVKHLHEGVGNLVAIAPG